MKNNHRSKEGSRRTSREAVLALNQGDVFPAKVTSVFESGALAVFDVNGAPVHAFMPRSHCCSPLGSPQSQLKHGQEIALSILDVNVRKGRVLASPRVWFLSNLKVGQILEGIIANRVAFGYFVDLTSVEGLLHASQVEPGRTYQIGQRVQVRIRSLDLVNGRVSLTMLQRGAVSNRREVPCIIKHRLERGRVHLPGSRPTSVIDPSSKRTASAQALEAGSAATDVSSFQSGSATGSTSIGRPARKSAEVTKAVTSPSGGTAGESRHSSASPQVDQARPGVFKSLDAFADYWQSLHAPEQKSA